MPDFEAVIRMDPFFMRTNFASSRYKSMLNCFLKLVSGFGSVLRQLLAPTSVSVFDRFESETLVYCLVKSKSVLLKMWTFESHKNCNYDVGYHSIWDWSVGLNAGGGEPGCGGGKEQDCGHTHVWAAQVEQRYRHHRPQQVPYLALSISRCVGTRYGPTKHMVPYPLTVFSVRALKCFLVVNSNVR